MTDRQWRMYKLVIDLLILIASRLICGADTEGKKLLLEHREEFDKISNE